MIWIIAWQLLRSPHDSIYVYFLLLPTGLLAQLWVLIGLTLPLTKLWVFFLPLDGCLNFISLELKLNYHGLEALFLQGTNSLPL